jgi:HAD superfamily hydrolase (TIGR01509 family)
MLVDVLRDVHPVLARASAVIFDMDGVLADTEPIHEQTTQALVARRGVALSSAEYASFTGVTIAETWRLLAERFEFRESLKALTSEYEFMLIQALLEGLVAAPGAIKLVTALRENGVPLALASSSTRRVVDVVLGAIGLGNGFSAVVCGDDVRESKPHPEIFWEAARRLGIAASACVVIEDSLAGIRAGRRAGMTVVGLRSRYTLGFSLPADLVVDSLTELMGAPADLSRDGASGA